MAMPARRRHSNGPAANGNGRSKGRASSKIRYAVVGLGHIAQVAVLPAFAHARRNSELVALVSGDPRKQSTLARRYGIANVYNYDDYEDCLHSGEIDAVYIALPNSMHRDFTIRAARAGIHVLCEKPLAVTERECADMIRACDAARVQLMTAYRLHFDPANLRAVQFAHSGKIGEPRLFNSSFTMQVKDPDNIRLRAEAGGGPLYDIGIYCINAIRYLFRDEPEEVFALASPGDDKRFREVDASVSAVLRYPGDRLATFTCSFGAANTGYYQLIGDRGDVCVDPAYEYAEPLGLHLTVNDKSREFRFARHDQFAAELLHFSDCVIRGRRPEPSGLEGLLDVRIIEALDRSIRTGRPVRLPRASDHQHPTPRQRAARPPVRKRSVIHAKSPH